MGRKISQFPAATTINDADVLAGVQGTSNRKFSMSLIKGWLQSVFVPTTREVNGKALSSDITLDASDVGAVDVNDVGVAGGVAELDSTGKVPNSQLPPIASAAEDVTYDNTGSGLTATDVQDAIDELAAGAGGGGVDPETIAPVENTTTATVAHPLGTIFYLNDVLYRALADIAVGGTINTGTGGNATPTSVAQNFKRTVTLTSAEYAQLSAAEKAADIVYIITDEAVDYAHEGQLAYVESGSTATKTGGYVAGQLFCWGGFLYRATTTISVGNTFVEGTNCEKTTVDAELQAKGNTKYTGYVLSTAQTKTHIFSDSCQFLILTQRVLATSGDQSNGVYFGYVGKTNVNTSRIYPIYTPASDPVTFTFGAGTLDMTTSLSVTRITIIEFPRTV